VVNWTYPTAMVKMRKWTFTAAMFSRKLLLSSLLFMVDIGRRDPENKQLSWSRIFFHQGVITAVIGYELAPVVSMEKMVQGIVKATSFLNDWCTRRGSNGLYLCGHSAGAHLLASAVMTDSKNLDQVTGIFLLSGVYDLVPLIGTYVDRPLGLTLETARQFSPSHQIRTLPESSRGVLSDFNIRVVNGGHESPAFIEQSKQFFDQLTTLNLLIDPGYHMINDMDHFSLIESLDDPNSVLCKLMCHWMGLAVG